MEKAGWKLGDEEMETLLELVARLSKRKRAELVEYLKGSLPR